MLRQGMTPHAVAQALHREAGISLNTASRRAQLQLAGIEARADADRLREALSERDREVAALRTVIAGLLSDQHEIDADAASR